MLQEFLMGTGAVFGLTSALVGQTLPGSGPAIATGNALAEGPVVFYWPQQIIDELEQNASQDANNEWLQLRVDLFRQALHLNLCSASRSKLQKFLLAK